MDSNSPKTYSILAIALVIALAVSGYFIFNTFLPQYTTAQNTQSAANATNANLKKALDSVQVFLANYKQQSGNVARVQLALPAGDADMPNFVSSMSQLAAASGVSLSNFQINTQASEGGAPAARTIQTEDFGVSASGSFASFKDFISRVESHLRLIDVYHVSVSTGASGATADPILQFQIKIHTYFQE